MGRLYHEIITEATGITDINELAEIEDCMRHTIFHSTLDWQTRAQLKQAARESVTILEEVRKMEASGYGDLYT